MTEKRYSLSTLFFFIMLITFYRFAVLYFSDANLYADEAYYWGWSQSFEFGYYSKPPMIAWIIAVFTSICGDSEICIKLPSLFIYPLTTIIIYKIAEELFDKKTAFFSGLVFITIPAVSMSSLIISTDVVLLFFWSLTLYLFIKALKTERKLFWILAGVSAGFGLLSKYTMIIFVISVFVYLAMSKEHRKFLKSIELYITMALAAIIYLPNLYWNYKHHFVSFVHTKEISEIDRQLFHFDKMFEFLGAQFAVFGPVLFAVLLYLLFRPFIKDDRYRLLYSFTVPFLAIITLQSFLSRAFANWAAPTYIAATLLVSAYLVYKNRDTLLKTAIAVNIILALAFYHYHAITSLLGIELTSKTDPYKRVLGWKELGEEVSKILKEYPDAKLLCDDRKTMAELIYYVRPHPFDAVIWNPKGKMKNHYDLTTDMQKHIGENFIFVTKRRSIGDVASRFEKAKKIGSVKIRLYKDFSRVYHIYYLQGFKGYR
ncbi:ArnT family glycosyltransferase [Nitrosophilus alvini]|uniref:ArnT family glycosyltransferase n=1 Tax=Nitrosophilus alvini TaxID=2714855 RepID=UPI00190B4023|nr:glycosyltransferase family 39 protein [Nitrosophilus alvini]